MKEVHLINELETVDKTEPEVLDYRRTIRKIKNNALAVGEKVIGREEIITQFVFALVTGNHQLLLGRTGIAKSMLADELFRMFTPSDTSIFRIKASVEDTKDNYFGPINIPHYRERGEKLRNITDSLLKADLAFIDEIFDTNEQILRDLMLILSDNRLQEGPITYRSRLKTAIAACNYLRQNEVTEALIDRFAFRAIVPAASDPVLQYRIDQSYLDTRADRKAQFESIAMNEIENVRAVIAGNHPEHGIEIPGDIIFIKNVIVRDFVDAMRKNVPDYYISPRRQAKTLDLLKASAMIEGRDRVEDRDLGNIHYMLTTLNNTNDEQKVLKQEVERKVRFYNVNRTLRETIIVLTRALAIVQEIRQGRRPEKLLAAIAIPEFHQGRKMPWRERLFGRSDGTMTIDSLRQFIAAIEPEDSNVRDLKNLCESKLQQVCSFPQLYTANGTGDMAAI